MIRTDNKIVKELWITDNHYMSIRTYPVEKIVEHQAQGDGDRWFYDVVYTNGEVHRYFNFHHVVFIEGDKE